MPRVHEDVKIAFYSVDRCGYYPYGRSKKAPFCNLDETLQGLYDWVHQDGMTLSQTQTFEVAQDSDDFLTLCYDIQKNDAGEFLLATWNAVPSVYNQVAAVRGTGPVGTASVVTTQFGDEDIPGFATYFWFLPDTNSFATVRFQHAVNGQGNMRKFVAGYLKNMSKYVYRKSDKNGEEVTSYKMSAKDSGNSRPTFITSQKRLPGQIDLIKKQVGKITKVVQTTKLEPIIKANHKAFYSGALKVLGLKTPNVQRQEVEIRNEMRMPVSGGELTEIIDAWEVDATDKGSSDVGFVMRGESNKVYWLSKSMANAEFKLMFNRQDGNNEIVESKSLLKALHNEKDKIHKEAYNDY